VFNLLFNICSGWIGSDVNYSTTCQDTSSTRLSVPVHVEKLIPKDEPNQWWMYDNESTVVQFMHALNERGIREQNLLQNLKKIFPLLQIEFEQMKTKASSMETIHHDPLPTTDIINEQPHQHVPVHDILQAFKNDLEDMETRLRHGSLGGFIVADNLHEWQTKLKQTTERTELADLLIQLQQTVAEKYATGFFGTHERQVKSSKLPSRKKSSTVKLSSNHSHHLHIWMNDCRTCKTYSRLYVLMMILENSIAWNKSALGLKCKICRRKNKDESIVVCDQCCQGYHHDCLRGYTNNHVKTSLNQLWFCPACCPQPISKRRTGRQTRSTKSKNDYYDTDIYDMDVDNRSNVSSHEQSAHDDDHDEDLSDFASESSERDAHGGDHHDHHRDDQAEYIEDHSCRICGVQTSDDNELIQCIQCRSYFHCQCHEPPLRCAPRSTTWMCTNCRNSVNNETVHTSTRRVRTRQQLAIKQHKTKVSTRQARSNGTRRSM
jgi:hypothetical protein